VKPNHWLDREPRGPVPAGVAEAICAAKAGTLDRNALVPFGCHPPGVDWWRFPSGGIRSFDARDAFIREVGFMVPSRQWLDSMARFLHASGLPRVLEVCAGHGTLVAPMRARGIAWDAVDEAPRGPDVREGDALTEAEAAVRGGLVDALFASWLPMDGGTDQRLASLGVPFVVVGEPPGGCTGSEGFAESKYRVEYARDVIEGWEDPPQWVGLHDLTMIATPLSRPAFGRSR
jgi:hypothetical protein